MGAHLAAEPDRHGQVGCIRTPAPERGSSVNKQYFTSPWKEGFSTHWCPHQTRRAVKHGDAVLPSPSAVCRALHTAAQWRGFLFPPKVAHGREGPLQPHHGALPFIFWQQLLLPQPTLSTLQQVRVSGRRILCGVPDDFKVFTALIIWLFLKRPGVHGELGELLDGEPVDRGVVKCVCVPRSLRERVLLQSL